MSLWFGLLQPLTHICTHTHAYTHTYTHICTHMLMPTKHIFHQGSYHFINTHTHTHTHAHACTNTHTYTHSDFGVHTTAPLDDSAVINNLQKTVSKPPLLFNLEQRGNNVQVCHTLHVRKWLHIKSAHRV